MTNLFSPNLTWDNVILLGIWFSNYWLNLSKEKFKNTSADLEDTLAEVEKNLLGLGSTSLRSELPKPQQIFFNLS